MSVTRCTHACTLINRHMNEEQHNKKWRDGDAPISVFAFTNITKAHRWMGAVIDERDASWPRPCLGGSNPPC